MLWLSDGTPAVNSNWNIWFFKPQRQLLIQKISNWIFGHIKSKISEKQIFQVSSQAQSRKVLQQFRIFPEDYLGALWDVLVRGVFVLTALFISPTRILRRKLSGSGAVGPHWDLIPGISVKFQQKRGWCFWQKLEFTPLLYPRFFVSQQFRLTQLKLRLPSRVPRRTLIFMHNKSTPSENHFHWVWDVFSGNDGMPQVHVCMGRDVSGGTPHASTAELTGHTELYRGQVLFAMKKTKRNNFFSTMKRLVYCVCASALQFHSHWIKYSRNLTLICQICKWTVDWWRLSLIRLENKLLNAAIPVQCVSLNKGFSRRSSLSTARPTQTFWGGRAWHTTIPWLLVTGVADHFHLAVNEKKPLSECLSQD